MDLPEPTTRPAAHPAAEARAPRWRSWWPPGRVGLALGAIFLVTLVIRVGWVAHLWSEDSDAVRWADSPTYVQPGLAIERHARFSEGPDNHTPIYFRTPGYPAFIAAVFVVAGEHELAVLMAQIALSIVSIGIAFAVANRVWGPAAGLLTALVLALDPLQFWAAGTLLTESLMGFLLLLAVAIGFRVFARRPVPIGWPVLLGLVLALATLVRPVTYYLLVIVVLALAVRALRQRSRSSIGAAVAFLLPVLLLVGGWQVRNQQEVGSARIAGVEGFNMYWYRAAGVTAELEGTDLATVQRRIRREEPTAPERRDEPGSYFDSLYERGVDIVLDHPWEALTTTVAGLDAEVRQTGADLVPRFYLLNFPGPARVPLALWLGAFWVTAVFGAVRALTRDRARRPAHLFALGVAGYVLLVSAGPGADYRFRVPVYPILALYAAAGTMAAWHLGRDAWGRRTARAGTSAEPIGS